ncbi:MAG: LTA synthase family protein [candidate division Zixibacteria bacterium]|nr:LTA synthase family protein [candidate division Zixibacteria bacterium]
MLNLLRNKIIHPFLFGVFPILFLSARNITQMRLGEITVPLIAAICITIVLSIIISRLIKEPRKSGLVISLFLLFLYSYGHLLGINSRFYFRIDGTKIGPDINVFILWIVLLSISLFFTIRSRRDLAILTRLANSTAVLLVTIQIFLIGQTVIFRSEVELHNDIAINSDIPGELPDIYHIILDGYGRQDILRQIYNVDNSALLDKLTRRGFIIADSSNCNYYATQQSLTSLFNLDYLQSFDILSPQARDCIQMESLLSKNRVFKHLARYGYKTVAFTSGYYMTDLKKVDYYYTPGMAFSEFQNIVLNTTPIPFISRSGKSQYELHRERINYILKKLPHLNNIHYPKMVFAHVICPHPPFVFGEHGEPVQVDRPFYKGDGSLYIEHGGTKEEYIAGYSEQIKYISKRIIKTIDEIIANSDRPPIIILQGDHGPASDANWENLAETNVKERYGILNAYYLPGQNKDIIYSSITPVNSYRVIFNHYFSTNFELLADESYFNLMSQPYAFVEITGELVGTKEDQ